ncbi:hypothetical protein WP50_15940 [Lactiplantibacillus plantarum]|nr:hypothetical protein WP50_15940 [Lactiplantibacillus plantarum]
MKTQSNRVLNLIAANQKLVQKNQENNADELTSMVSDVQGHQIPYQLTIQHPKKYRNTELYLVLDGISYRRSSIKHALTLDKVIIYRNQHATGASNNALTKLPADTITLTPEQRESLTPATGLTTPSNRVLNLIAANQKLVQKNQENNADELTSMVSDVQGHQIPYQLTIQHPKKYRNTELYLVLDGISYRRSSIKHALTTSQNINVFTARPYTKVDYLDDVRDGLKGNLSASGYSLTAQTTDNLTSFSQLGTTNMSDYEPRTSAVINLGYSKYARKLITLNFTSIRSLHFKSAKLIAVPLGKTYRQRTRQLQTSGLN